MFWKGGSSRLWNHYCHYQHYQPSVSNLVADKVLRRGHAFFVTLIGSGYGCSIEKKKLDKCIINKYGRNQINKLASPKRHRRDSSSSRMDLPLIFLSQCRKILKSLQYIFFDYGLELLPEQLSRMVKSRINFKTAVMLLLLDGTHMRLDYGVVEPEPTV